MGTARGARGTNTHTDRKDPPSPTCARGRDTRPARGIRMGTACSLRRHPRAPPARHRLPSRPSLHGKRLGCVFFYSPKTTLRGETNTCRSSPRRDGPVGHSVTGSTYHPSRRSARPIEGGNFSGFVVPGCRAGAIDGAWPTCPQDSRTAGWHKRTRMRLMP